MGKIILYLFLLLSVCTEALSQTGSQDGGYRITGRIVGLPDGDLFLVTDNEVKISGAAVRWLPLWITAWSWPRPPGAARPFPPSARAMIYATILRK